MVSRMLKKVFEDGSGAPPILYERRGESAVSGSARRLLAPLKPAARSSRSVNGSRLLCCRAGQAAPARVVGVVSGRAELGRAGARASAERSGVRRVAARREETLRGDLRRGRSTRPHAGAGAARAEPEQPSRRRRRCPGAGGADLEPKAEPGGGGTSPSYTE